VLCRVDSRRSCLCCFLHSRALFHFTGALHYAQLCCKAGAATRRYVLVRCCCVTHTINCMHAQVQHGSRARALALPRHAAGGKLGAARVRRRRLGTGVQRSLRSLPNPACFHISNMHAARTQAASNRAVRPWIVVVGHRPMLSSDNSEWSEHNPTSQHFQVMRTRASAACVSDVVALHVCRHTRRCSKNTKSIWYVHTRVRYHGALKRHAAQYLCGHMHMYEQIKPTYVNGTVARERNARGVYVRPPMPVQVVQGTHTRYGGVTGD
jgi:hypothetical protein